MFSGLTLILDTQHTFSPHLSFSLCFSSVFPLFVSSHSHQLAEQTAEWEAAVHNSTTDFGESFRVTVRTEGRSCTVTKAGSRWSNWVLLLQAQFYAAPVKPGGAVGFPDVSPADQRTVQPGNRQACFLSFHCPEHSPLIHMWFIQLRLFEYIGTYRHGYVHWFQFKFSYTAGN